jgi:hypothetical protein
LTLGPAGKGLGLHVLGGGPDGRNGTVVIDVAIANGDLQRAVDARYGVVKLFRR